MYIHMTQKIASKKHCVITPLIREDSTVRVATHFQQIWERGKEEYDADENNRVVED